MMHTIWQLVKPTAVTISFFCLIRSSMSHQLTRMLSDVIFMPAVQ